MKNKKWLCVAYHNTFVVCASDKTIVLNTGGWFTVTTKTRMNQASNQFGLGYRVFQKDFRWYVEFKGKVRRFITNKVTLRLYTPKPRKAKVEDDGREEDEEQRELKAIEDKYEMPPEYDGDQEPYPPEDD
jgi:hypothetical protein